MKKILVVLLCVSSATLWAAATQEQRQTTGYGDSYQAALAGALLEAVRQVSGVEVGTEKALRSEIAASLNDAGYTLRVQTNVARDLYTKSKGRISTYEVVSVKEPTKEGAKWQVVALVSVPVYANAGPQQEKRKSIAVLPFEVIPETRYSGDTAAITHRLADSLASELNQSMRFAVLNRSFEKQMKREGALWESNQVSSVEASRLGNKLGADFIVLGKIYQLDFRDDTKNYYGLQRKQRQISADLYFTVVEAATEKVLWSETLTYEHSPKDRRHAVTEFVAGVSSIIATQLLEAVHPVKILKLAEEPTVLLNQGGKRLRQGQRWTVYTPAAPVIDPDTGMTISIEGEAIAELEVVQVKPKYSVAKLVPGSGRFVDLEANAVIRQVKPARLISEPPERELTAGSSDKPVNWGGRAD